MSLVLSGNGLQRSNFGYSGAVLQTVQAFKVDTFTTTASGNTAIPGLVVNITPTSANSKFLITYGVNYDANRPNSGGGFRITRNTSLLDGFNGGPDGTKYRVNADFGKNAEQDQSMMHRSGCFLDTPNTTNQLTYQLCVWKDGGFTFWCNKATANDGADDPVTASHLTVMEIAG